MPSVDLKLAAPLAKFDGDGDGLIDLHELDACLKQAALSDEQRAALTAIRADLQQKAQHGERAQMPYMHPELYRRLDGFSGDAETKARLSRALVAAYAQDEMAADGVPTLDEIETRRKALGQSDDDSIARAARHLLGRPSLHDVPLRQSVRQLSADRLAALDTTRNSTVSALVVLDEMRMLRAQIAHLDANPSTATSRERADAARMLELWTAVDFQMRTTGHVAEFAFAWDASTEMRFRDKPLREAVRRIMAVEHRGFAADSVLQRTDTDAIIASIEKRLASSVSGAERERLREAIALMHAVAYVIDASGLDGYRWMDDEYYRLGPAARTLYDQADRQGDGDGMMSIGEWQAFLAKQTRPHDLAAIAEIARLKWRSQPGVDVDAVQRATGLDVAVASLPREMRLPAQRIVSLLTQAPPPRAYKENLRLALDALPAEQRDATCRLLNAHSLFLPNLSSGSPTTEDASSRIRFMYMRYEPGYAIGRAYVADMVRVAAREHFQLVLSIADEPDACRARLIDDLVATGVSREDAVSIVRAHVEWSIDNAFDNPKGQERAKGWTFWAEDNKWLTQADDVGAQVQIKTLPQLTPSAIAAAHAFMRVGPGRSVQGAVNARNEMDLAALTGQTLGRDVVTTRTYNEGGNLLVGTRPNGDAYAVMGHDGVVLTLFTLAERFAADPDSVPEFAPDVVEARARQLTASGRINPQDEALVGLELRNAGLASPTPGQDGRIFLARASIVEDLFATDLGVKRADLCVVPQPDFHIDMFMRPLGPSQVMVNDFRACVALLDATIAEVDAKMRARGNERSRALLWQRAELVEMRKNALAKQEVLGPVVDDIENRLRAAGIEVIAAPGVMEGLPLQDAEGRVSTRKVNFMNAVPGTSLGTCAPYYCTNATSVSVLQEAFERFLKAHGIQRVYWIGGAGGGEGKRNMAERSLEWFGGLDCMENHHEGLHADVPKVKDVNTALG